MEIPLGRMNVRFEDINSIEAQAFKVCNTDGEEGLTWLEVEACEVKMVLKSNLPKFERDQPCSLWLLLIWQIISLFISVGLVIC